MKDAPKYEALSHHLRSATRPITTTMTFDEISRLVGGCYLLTPRLYQHAAWWANDQTHVQAKAWLDLGLRVQEVHLSNARLSSSRRPSFEGDHLAAQVARALARSS